MTEREEREREERERRERELRNNILIKKQTFSSLSDLYDAEGGEEVQFFDAFEYSAYLVLALARLREGQH